jgi:hypothetical protein
LILTREQKLFPVFSNKSKGQAAIEYLMVFGIALALSTPFIVKAQSSIVDLRQGSGAVELHNSLNKMESAIKTVDASGEPAKRTFLVELPQSVESGQIKSDAIIYNVSSASGSAQMIRSYEINITGKVPQDAGNNRVSVEAKSDSVNISVVS